MNKFFKLSLLLLVFILLSDQLLAIPAFARMYKMSCQTCHSPFPRLKAYGDEFAGNGFVLNDQEPARYFLDTGDDELNLIRDFPIAVRMEAHVTYRDDKPEGSDFKTPYLLKLLSGGSLTKNLAYYFYMYFDERGEVAGVEDAYLMFNNLFGTELDLYIGQFQISDPLFKRELRLTLEDYEIYKTKVASSNFNLAYDRGIMLTYGFETGTDIMVEVLNGNGLEDAGADKLFDNDNYKNLFGRISQDIGENLRIGGFAYHGKENQNINDPTNALENTLFMYGPDVTLSMGDQLELNLQYVMREDDHKYLPTSTLGDNKIETKGAIAELVWTPKGDESKWYGVGLFNWVESDINALNYKTIAGHLGYMFKRNIRIVAEVKYDFVHEYIQPGIGIISAF
jgi:hypothetical protein